MTKNERNAPALPTELLQRLCAAARAFRELECWKWMWDSEVFGVRNPAGGEISYCSVLGRLREHFAIMAYRGSEGLNAHLSMSEAETPIDQYESYFSQIGLSVSFEEKEFLDEEDRRMLRQAGYTARGPHPWPQFRSHSPGFEPWYVNADEAEFLIHVLEQAAEVAVQLRRDPDLLDSPNGDEFLVRTPEKGPSGMTWSNGWVHPAMPELPDISGEPLDEVRAARIRKTIPRSADVWEIGCFYAPGYVVGEGPRPYLPRMTMCVDQDSGRVLLAHAVPLSQHAKAFPGHIMECIEGTGVIPQTMLARDLETIRMLARVASSLEIETALSRDLPGLTEAMSSLFEHLGRPGMQGPGLLGPEKRPSGNRPRGGRGRKGPRRR